MKKALSLVLAAVMAFSLVACGGSSSSTASAGSTGSASGSTTSNVTVQIGPNPESIDPALNSTIDGGNMLITAFEGLLIVDENNRVQPGQAESWEVSEDGLTWMPPILCILISALPIPTPLLPTPRLPWA